MNRFLRLAVVAAPLMIAGGAQAQYPILEAAAEKVIQRYQSSTCEQLWERRGKHTEEEQRALTFLRNDPQMRRVFFDKVSGPIVNKMFECGMIP